MIHRHTDSNLRGGDFGFWLNRRWLGRLGGFYAELLRYRFRLYGSGNRLKLGLCRLFGDIGYIGLHDTRHKARLLIVEQAVVFLFAD